MNPERKPGGKPVVLLAAAYRWFATARLAMALSRGGCSVDTVCPPEHPVDATLAVRNRYAFQALRPIRSLRRAIEAARPDLVIPCDEPTAIHLHRLYSLREHSAHPQAQVLRRLLRNSLGDPASHAILESREAFLSAARAAGIRAPETIAVTSTKDVEEAFARFGTPAVLKADGTSGGEGVVMVRTRVEAVEAFRRLSAPVGATVVAKRACIDRDMNLVAPWLRRAGRTVTMQPFVYGHDANIAIACWKGKVLASVAAEVLRTRKSKGPAAIIRLTGDNRILNAAETMVEMLGLSGLCGLDFLIEEGTGEPWLLEINARATQTCHLPVGPEGGPAAALAEALGGISAPPVEDAPLHPGSMVALFPAAWQHDPANRLLRSAYHDVPWEEPELLRLGVARESRITYDNWVRFWNRIGGSTRPRRPGAGTPLREEA